MEQRQPQVLAKIKLERCLKKWSKQSHACMPLSAESVRSSAPSGVNPTRTEPSRISNPRPAHTDRTAASSSVNRILQQPGITQSRTISVERRYCRLVRLQPDPVTMVPTLPSLLVFFSLYSTQILPILSSRGGGGGAKAYCTTSNKLGPLFPFFFSQYFCVKIVFIKIF